MKRRRQKEFRHLASAVTPDRVDGSPSRATMGFHEPRASRSSLSHLFWNRLSETAIHFLRNGLLHVPKDCSAKEAPMPAHPKFRVVMASELPDLYWIFKIEVNHEGDWYRFEDQAFTNETDALTAIPELQATGRLPTDAELNS